MEQAWGSGGRPLRGTAAVEGSGGRAGERGGQGVQAWNGEFVTDLLGGCSDSGAKGKGVQVRNRLGGPVTGVQTLNPEPSICSQPLMPVPAPCLSSSSVRCITRPACPHPLQTLNPEHWMCPYPCMPVPVPCCLPHSGVQPAIRAHTRCRPSTLNSRSALNPCMPAPAPCCLPPSGVQPTIRAHT